MGITTTPFSCKRGALTILGTEYRPEGEQLPIVIVSHGFGGIGSDNAGYAQQLAEWGFAAYVFDFCGGSPRSSSDGAFQEMTVFTEQADLETVMDYVTALPYVDASRLTLMGCSQGGFVSALVAAARPQRVAKLVMFYPALSIPEDSRNGSMLMYSFDPQNVPDLVEAVMPPDIPFQMPPLGGEYVRCVQKMDAFSTIAAYPGPVLIVHGDSDKAVPVVNSRRAQAAYNSVKPRRCQLAEIAGADHGFKDMEDTHAMELVREFVRGRTNVLSVDVVLTGFSKEEKDGETILTLPFGGVIRTPFFTGLIQPGAADVQRWKGQTPIRLCADYTLRGTDYTGAPCSVHIVNEDTGGGWHPTVTTDSKALDFLNGAELTEALEMRRVGPVVRIFAKLPEGE